MLGQVLRLRFKDLLFAAFAALFLLSAGTSTAAPVPVVHGNQLVDSTTGRQFLPRGVNFPGFEYACQQGWGYGNSGTGPGQVEQTVSAIADWHINTVRLPLNQDCWLGDDGLPAGELTTGDYRDAVENFVSALNAVGIVAVLDLHWTGPNGVEADGLRPLPDDRSPAFWGSVASRFRLSPSVIFDLFNEPHSRWGTGSWLFELGWDCWADGGCDAPAEADTDPESGLDWYQTTGMRSLAQAVRSTGAAQPILVSGIDYANDLRGWLANRPVDSQLIAGFHNYPIQRCHEQSCWNSEIGVLASHVPVLAAEFGQNDCESPDHMNNFMKWADSRGIGYLAWAWWVLPVLGCDNYALISDLDGTPLAPAGTALHDHLAELEREPTAPDPVPVRPEDPPRPEESVRPDVDGKEVVVVKRRHSRLKIRQAVWRNGKLRLRIQISPLASFAVRLRLRLIVDPAAAVPPTTDRRLIRRNLTVSSSREKLVIANIPAGLKPTLVIASYPGDQRLRPKTVRKRLSSSVSGVTRRSGST